MTEITDGQYSFDLARGEPLVQESADYLRCYLDDAAAWLNDDAQVRRRRHWHLTGTDVPSEQHAGIADRQRRHAQEVLAAFGQRSAPPRSPRCRAELAPRYSRKLPHELRKH